MSSGKSTVKSTVTATRSQTAIWLVGHPQPNLPENSLPTTGEVLQTFMHHHVVLLKTVPESLKSTTIELVGNWNRARIPVAFQPNIISKMKGLVDEYNLIKKNKSRRSEAQTAREKAFTYSTTLLFDVAHKEADTIIKIEEDKVFLADQRSTRKMFMHGIDKKLSKQEQRSKDRREVEEKRIRREEQRQIAASATDNAVLDNHSESDSSIDNAYGDKDYEIEIPVHFKKLLKVEETSCSTNPSQSKKPKMIQTLLSSPDVSSALDRINLSDNKFTILAAAIAKASGEDLKKDTLSRSTVYRKRSAHRSTIEACIRGEFHSTDKPPLVVHWDGKLMRDTTNKEDPKSKTDRIAVGVTGHLVDKILGIAKMPTGTGHAQASATYQLLSLWEVIPDVIGMCFDTTASNTGPANGACVLLEQKLQKNLLYFACRHHVHEIIIGSVFTVLFGPSRSPNIPLFERFQRFWPNIDQRDFKSLADPRLSDPHMMQLREDAISFLQGFLVANNVYMPREDYREMIQLCLLILGASPQAEISQESNSEETHSLRLPGAYHLARWMAKVIYCFKFYLFRDQFKLTAAEQRHLAEFCMFASHIYVRAWISCPVTCDAAVNDLQLYKQIKQYASINQAVSEAAIKKLDRHLWYIGPELILLSLFSDKPSLEEKRLIVNSLQQCGDDWSVRGYKLEETTDLNTKELHHLVTSSSMAALRSLGLDITFISGSDPSAWSSSETFRATKAIICSIKVVNDAAERSVALMSTFNESITRNETEMQRLIQVVEDHRKRVPDARKGTLVAYNPR